MDFIDFEPSDEFEFVAPSRLASQRNLMLECDGKGRSIDITDREPSVSSSEKEEESSKGTLLEDFGSCNLDKVEKADSQPAATQDEDEQRTAASTDSVRQRRFFSILGGPSQSLQYWRYLDFEPSDEFEFEAPNRSLPSHRNLMEEQQCDEKRRSIEITALAPPASSEEESSTGTLLEDFGSCSLDNDEKLDSQTIVAARSSTAADDEQCSTVLSTDSVKQRSFFSILGGPSQSLQYWHYLALSEELQTNEAITNTTQSPSAA